jgi:NAD(P)-dependent dehydrogenase (short-subunit alcohol dehydrogenase family)
MLEGKIAIVTGAASGLGRAIAMTFARSGAHVVIADLQEDGELATELTRLGAPAAASVHLDVREPAACAAVFEDVVNEAGRIDILVNSAGVREISEPLSLAAEEWANVIAVDLSGTFYCAQAAARQMARVGGGGSIINIASVAGLMGISGRVAYSAAKHGVVGMSKVLARDLAVHRIRVNALCPGLIRTPANDFYYEDESFLRALRDSVPLGPTGVPEDIAQAALFLASDMSSFVTGIALPVDGGWIAEKSYGPYNAESLFHQPYRSTAPAT